MLSYLNWRCSIFLGRFRFIFLTKATDDFVIYGFTHNLINCHYFPTTRADLNDNIWKKKETWCILFCVKFEDDIKLVILVVFLPDLKVRILWWKKKRENRLRLPIYYHSVHVQSLLPQRVQVCTLQLWTSSNLLVPLKALVPLQCLAARKCIMIHFSNRILFLEPFSSTITLAYIRQIFRTF